LTTVTTTFCDICQRQLFEMPPAPGAKPDRPDAGVWFNGGTIGIPHVCGDCQEKTTIAECRRRLKLAPIPAPVP